jgi:1,4-alpha-glucan branching enzyme
VQEAMPATSSWGQGGYHTVWLSGENDWIYRHLDRAGARMSELAGRFPDARGFELRALNQCARELLLSQSSDWAFMMSRGTFAEYAIRRVREHLAHFTELADALVARQVDPAMLADLEARNPVFPAMDYRVFR